MPKVSIITALYNHEKYFTEAVESVLAQTYSDWEYLIWDDGSSDQSYEIAGRYAEKHPEKIKFFTHPNHKNLGQEATRNAALQKSAGELVCLLDSDDIYHPQKLERLVPCLANSRVGLAYGKTDVRMEDTGKLLSDGIQEHPSGKVFDALIRENFISASGVLLRRECFDQGLKFESEYKTCGEYPLWLKIAQNWEVQYVPEVVSWWRCHGKNLGTKLALRAKAEIVQMTEKFAVDQKYDEHRPAIMNALAQRRYDYANELYFHQAFLEARSQLKTVFREAESSKLKLKAGSLLALTHLGRVPNHYLSKVKKQIWDLKKPF